MVSNAEIQPSDNILALDVYSYGHMNGVKESFAYNDQWRVKKVLDIISRIQFQRHDVQ